MDIPNEIEEIIMAEFVSSDVDQNILKSILEQESHFNPYVLRYEPTYNYLLNPNHYAQKLLITVPTETMTQKMSWGLGQIMGGLARELGFEDHMGHLLRPEINIEYVCKYLLRIQINAKTPDAIFACYNGGMGALLNQKDGKFPNQGYVDSCMNHLAKWRRG